MRSDLKKNAVQTLRLLALTGALCAVAPAQLAQTQPAVDPANPDSFYGKEPTEGVYVRDSTIAVEKLANAQRMERLKEWGKAADYYQEVITKYPDRVVPSQLDKDKRIYQYTSITYRVQEKLAHWPAEGLEVYRARYEAPAQAMLDSARPDDAATLHKVYSQYFVTEAGKKAGIRLIDLYMESGEFPAAAWLGDRLLQLHPGLLAERAAVLYRTSLAYYYAGDSSKSKQRLAELTSRFPNDRGVVRGKDVLLARSLTQETQAPLANSLEASADSYRMIGGNPSHSLVTSAEGKPGARLFGIPLSKPVWPNVPANQRLQLEAQYKSAVESGMTLGILPVTDRGELYFQDGQHLYARSIESGVALPGWAQTWPNGTYAMPGAAPATVATRERQLTCTLTDHEVLAIMGTGSGTYDARAAMMGLPIPPGDDALVCLDRDTGRQKWVATPRQLPEEAKEERGVRFSGSPLVVGDTVLVVGRSVKQAQFEDCYVLAFDESNGKFRWATYVASANVAPMMFGMGGMPVSESQSASHLAYANGRVFVQTNLGAFAALDAYGGAVVWLDIYPTDRQAANQQPINPFMQQNQFQQPAAKPWSFNPVIVSNGCAFTLPTDSQNLLVYDTANGVELKRIDLADIEQKANSHGVDSFTHLQTMLGVVGDDVVLCAEKGAMSLNWRKYSREAFDTAQDNFTNWIENYKFPIRGRGFLMKDSVYVPCGDQLYRHDLRTGKEIDAYPNHPSTSDEVKWEAPEEPGNVLATNDHVVIAGAKMVNVYTDVALAKVKLDRELAAAPSDPTPRLRYAEVMFVAGEPDSALAKLDAAAGLMGGIKSLQQGVSRDRFFNDAITFADKLAKTPRDEDRARTNKLYDLAADAALSPVQQVHYRMSRAKFDQSIKDNAAAVKLYQQILADTQLRPVPLADEGSGAPTQADDVAQKAIAAIVKTDPAAYAPFQQAASAALEKAQAAKDDTAGKLLEVARTYPNSSVAAKAMLGAADAYEAASNPRQAIRVLRDMWFKYSQGPEKGTIAESLARNYLALARQPHAGAGDVGANDNVDAANARLAVAAALPGNPKLERDLTLPDGVVIAKGTPLDKALETTRKFKGEAVAKRLPDFHIPVPPRHAAGKKRPKAFAHGPEKTIPNISALVVPLRDFGRNDRVVTYTTGGTLDIYPAGKMQSLVSSKALASQPKGCAWIGDSLLVWSGTQITSVKVDSGKAVWKLDLATMPKIEVVHMGEIAEAEAAPNEAAVVDPFIGRRAFAVQQRRVAIRRLAAMNVAVQPPVVAAPPVVAGAEQIVAVRPVADRVLVTTTSGRILSAELTSGKIAWQTRLSDRPVDRLLANEDFVVVKVSDDSSVRIAAFDTATGRIRCTHGWSIQTGMVPVNLALAADGTLVYTMPTSLCLKDLYKPWGDPTDKEVQSAPGMPPFGGATRPDQLLISEGRVLALADSGSGSTKYVRVHSLETGQPLLLRYKSPKGDQEIEQKLEAGKSWNVSLRVIGPHLYVVGQDAVISYNLDRPAESWASHTDPQAHLVLHDTFIGQRFLALLDEPISLDDVAANAPAAPRMVVLPNGQIVGPNGQPIVPGPATPANGATTPIPQYRLELFGRYPVSDKNPSESGRLDYIHTIENPAGILSTWLGVDGGFYYLTADHNLHILEGSGAQQ